MTDCQAICREVVDQCAMPSIPSRASCLDGCLGGAERGADVESQLLCIELAECDLFTLVECEQAYGAR